MYRCTVLQVLPVLPVQGPLYMYIGKVVVYLFYLYGLPRQGD